MNRPGCVPVSVALNEHIRVLPQAATRNHWSLKDSTYRLNLTFLNKPGVKLRTINTAKNRKHNYSSHTESWLFLCCFCHGKSLKYSSKVCYQGSVFVSLTAVSVLVMWPLVAVRWYKSWPKKKSFFIEQLTKNKAGLNHVKNLYNKKL